MARSVTNDLSTLQVGIARYIRTDASFISGGGAAQLGAVARLRLPHRPTADIDVMVERSDTEHKTHRIEIPGQVFTVDVTGHGSMRHPFSPSILVSRQTDFLLILNDRSKLTVSYQGELRYEGLESVLPNKANVMVNRLHVRKGEVAKDLFDIGVLGSFVSPEIMEAQRVPFLRRAFYLAGALASMYPNQILKRVGSDLPADAVVSLSRSTVSTYKERKGPISEFAEANPVVLPVMVLAAANQSIKDRLPWILRMPDERKQLQLITDVNAAIISGIMASDRRALDKTMNTLLNGIRDMRRV